jgi:dihydrofolate reductase
MSNGTATKEERMAKLIYSAIMSLDGYIEDADGKFDWAQPDEEVHGFVNDRMRGIGTHLYGRRMYETMAVWETEPALAAGSPVTEDFARIWQAADKVVYSTTLDAVVTARTRIERAFDPDAVRRLKAAAGADLVVGGAELAGHAFRAGLVDEVLLVLTPVSVGGGKPALPRDVRVAASLVDERRFASGIVALRYRVAR